MRVIREISQLEPVRHGNFVPTMGALHEGHLALIRRAAAIGEPVVVSIFVNPTQFGPGEDFRRYPRDLDRDVAAAEKAGATFVFAPYVETMYPVSEDIAAPELPPAATQPGLEDRHRPGHFAGVCQVVARLFDLLRPRVAIFGEKDYQQLLVILQMVESVHEANAGRWGDLRILGEATVREPDGLALSSRNAYLRNDQRQRALGLNRSLQAAQTLVSESDNDVPPGDVESIMREVLEGHHLRVDYAVVRDAQSLLPIESLRLPIRALIAAHVDDVRLIDNVSLQ